MAVPSPRVLDLFAVPDDVAPLPGGRGDSVHAGDLVLSPGRDPEIARWAEAVCVFDAVLWLDADPSVMSDWSGPAGRGAMSRAAKGQNLAFRGRSRGDSLI